jgi:SAM-dependent methyltransferase
MPENLDLVRLRSEYYLRDHSQEKREHYSLFFEAQLFMIQQRQRVLIKSLKRNGFYPLSERKIIDIGCGEHGLFLECLAFGVQPQNLHGTDLLIDRLKIAHQTFSNVPVTNSDGQDLPYASQSFDLALQFTVFSSILDNEVRTKLAREMLRVLRPGGAILWYDFWLNPTNPQTRGIRPPEIRGLFPGCRFEFHRITLAPPIARRLVPLSWSLALLLESLKVFNSHYLAVIRPNA